MCSSILYAFPLFLIIRLRVFFCSISCFVVVIVVVSFALSLNVGLFSSFQQYWAKRKKKKLFIFPWPINIPMKEWRKIAPSEWKVYSLSYRLAYTEKILAIYLRVWRMEMIIWLYNKYYWKWHLSLEMEKLEKLDWNINLNLNSNPKFISSSSSRNRKKKRYFLSL